MLPRKKQVDHLDTKRIHQCIELLAQKGCQAVLDGIATLEAGDQLPETQGLDVTERSLVLTELRDVMEIYTDPSCADGAKE